MKITLTEYCNDGYVWAQMDFTHRKTRGGWDFATSYGEKPNDVAALYWPSTDYNRIDNTEYGQNMGTEEYSNIMLVGDSFGDLDPCGIAVEYDDYTDYLNEGEGSDSYYVDVSSYFGVKLSRYDPSVEPEDRIVTGDYHHNQNSCGLSGISVGSGGVTITGDCDTVGWQQTFDKGGQYLEETCRSY